MIKSKAFKFLLVCLTCIIIIAGLVFLIQFLTN